MGCTKAYHSTMNTNHPHHRHDLVRIANIAMRERGLEPEFSALVQKQLAGLSVAASAVGPEIEDLRERLWCSIDNDDSLDLDQLSVCEDLGGGRVRVSVAIADVDALVPLGCPIDDHACINTTSIYTSARVYPMLPELLSTNLTSLNAHVDRLAVVTHMDFAPDGNISERRVTRATVHNQAKLAYDAVSAWLEGQGPLPAAAAAVAGMDAQLRLQDEVAQRLRRKRHDQGSLEFETFQPRAVFDGDQVVGIDQQPQNRARQLIEELMIATNTCTAKFLAEHGGSSLRRVVREPERWMRIVNLAAKYGETLPHQPDSGALEVFLAKRRKADPLRFPDLSLVVVKLMGAGEYVVEQAGSIPVGHFGLAERDYTHSTAPNRRYPDLISQRMVKALLQGQPAPYDGQALESLARHCTEQEDAAKKVERRMRKSEGALYLERFIGHEYDAIVTGHNPTATWVRIFSPPIEGMLVGRLPDLDIGRKLRVKLLDTNVERGFIDFGLVSVAH